jgi:hypothetical protein
VSQVAFAPRAEYRHPDALGAVFINDAGDFNIRAAVEASPHEDGSFKVDDPAVEAVLDRRPELKRVIWHEPKAAVRRAVGEEKS